VSIYPIDPIVSAPPVGAAPPDGPSDPDVAARDSLLGLAAQTNGRTIFAATDLADGLKRLLADASGYYVLAWAPAAPRDGRFHPVDVRVAGRGLTVRARNGYWSVSPEELRARLTAVAPPAPANPYVPQRVSPLIRTWFGMARGQDGTTRVSFVWEPSPRVPGERKTGVPARSPARVALTVSTPDGAQVFHGVVMPAGVDADRSSLAVFEMAPGKLRVQMSIEDGASRVLDTDVRDLVVGGFRGPLTIGSIEVLRARNAREYNALAADPDAAPVAARQFSRAERLIVRIPVYAAGRVPAVSARLVSAFGAAMRDLPVTIAPATDTYQIDLPLAALASGAYSLELDVRSGSDHGTDSLSFRVIP
jgi:hypothetical protein